MFKHVKAVFNMLMSILDYPREIENNMYALVEHNGT